MEVEGAAGEVRLVPEADESRRSAADRNSWAVDGADTLGAEGVGCDDTSSCVRGMNL